MNALPVQKLSTGAADFIDDGYLTALLLSAPPEPAHVHAILAKSRARHPLSVENAADLLCVEHPGLRQEILHAAGELKRSVYGNRMVLFASLHVGVAFRPSARWATETEELVRQVRELVGVGYKRLLLVFGESSGCDADRIADCVHKVQATRAGHGGILRVDVLAPPLDHTGYRRLRAAGVGTCQVFQATYHHETFRRRSPALVRQGDFVHRLDAPSRAYEAGCDDVGLGALLGLYDWRFEALGLVSHAQYLSDRYGCGPRSIRLPRGEAAPLADREWAWIAAVLRLSVPFAGLILPVRDAEDLPSDVLACGVSEIEVDGGAEPLDKVVQAMQRQGHVPSFCTACHRLGRTGEHFMEYTIPGAMERFCTPNALSTLHEYLADYAGAETRAAGERLIQAELAAMPEGKLKSLLSERLHKLQHAQQRDLCF